MKFYMVSYEIVNDCGNEKDREENIIRIIGTYPGSIKLLDNTYFIQTFQDNQTLLDNLSNGLNDDDKMIIAQVDNITGKRTPNV